MYTLIFDSLSIYKTVSLLEKRDREFLKIIEHGRLAHVTAEFKDDILMNVDENHEISAKKTKRS